MLLAIMPRELSRLRLPEVTPVNLRTGIEKGE
jgi:hypothetical protein